jgi:anti-sigma factor RsiW
MGVLMIMNCKDVADKLSPFMDGELGAAMNQRMSMHIESCDSCKNELKHFHRIGVWMREVEISVDTEIIWGRIESAIPSVDQRDPHTIRKIP